MPLSWQESAREDACDEIEVLQVVSQKEDHPGKRLCIRMESFFNYRGHICIVFECLWSIACIIMELFQGERHFETLDDHDQLMAFEETFGMFPDWMVDYTE